MQVAQLWRHPVKSLRGEQLERVEVTHLGLVGDRRYGIAEVGADTVLTARRAPRLLQLTARWLPTPGGDHEDGTVEVTDEFGNVLPDDDALSQWLGRPVELRRAGEDGGVYENPADPFGETRWERWQGPGGAWHDSTRARVSLVSQATLGTWPPARFRSNVLLDGAEAPGAEDALVGRRVCLGEVLLEVTKPIDRCVMVTRAQRGIDTDPEVLRTIHRERDGNLAIGALVAAPGILRVGDRLEFA